MADPLCVDVKRAAEMLGGVSVWTVRAWIANRQLPVVKFPAVNGTNPLNRRIFIAVSDLEAFVKKYREEIPR